MGKFAGGKVDPVEAGRKGAKAKASGGGAAKSSGPARMLDGENYKPSEHGGLKVDGTPDKRLKQDQSASSKVDPHEAGKKGGETS